MTTMHMIYVGTRKIYAIKAVRMWCSIGLKEAKDAVEASSGFILDENRAAGIVAEYMRGNYKTDGTVNERFVSDWLVTPYVVSQPIDLTGTWLNVDAVFNGTGEV